MADSDLLSQDEIDALLSGVDSGEVETEIDADSNPGEAKLYDFNSQDRIVRGRMPTLEVINERVLRNLRQGIYDMLRRTPTLTYEGVQMTKFGEYVQTLLMPSNLNLVTVSPLKGQGLVVCNPKLVFSLVDCFFGGEGKVGSKADGREFTATELRIVRRFVDMLFGVMQEAWESVFPLEFGFVNAETNPQFAGIVTPSEVVVVSSFHVDLDGGAGTLHVTLPYTMIEPIRDLLTDGAKGDGSLHDERWTHVMHEEMKNAEVELHALLTRTELSLGDVMQLKPGDIVPIDLPQTVVAKVDDVPVFRGTYGASRGRAALKVVEPICHADYYSESQLTGASK